MGSADSNLYALNATNGELVWRYATGGEVASSPVVTNWAVMFGSYDGKVYAVDALTGMLRWSYQTGDKVVSSPALAHDTLYVGSYDHIVYAFGPAVETQPPTGT